MKKFSFLMLAAFFAASAMLVVSCSEDDDPDNAPTVVVKATYTGSPSGNIEDGFVIEEPVGTSIVLDLTFSMGKSKLTSVKATSKLGTRTFTVLDSTLNEGLFTGGSKDDIKFRYDTSVGLESEELVFTAIDKKNRTAIFNLKIQAKIDEVEIPAGVERYFTIGPETTFGAQAHPTAGSFYSVEGAKVYNLRGAKEEASRIDFAYFNAGTARVAAISDALVLDHKWSSTNTSLNPSGWSAKNATKFAVGTYSTSGSNADAISETIDGWWDELMEDVDEGNTNVEISKNSVVGFKTTKGVQGAFIVTDITGTSQGTLKVKFINKIEED